eukprot:scaffold110618_cov66-Attheya_sp.AAC.1
MAKPTAGQQLYRCAYPHPPGCVLTPRATCPGQAVSVPFQNEEQQPVQLKNTIALVCFFSQRQQNDGWRCAVLIPT